jgi:cytochrome b pre-mRNA-processing protein 3
LNPLDPLIRWRRKDEDAARAYGAIVAQARLPVFYQDLGVPDTLEGRFVVLSLHLFALLRRLKGEGEVGRNLAQALIDRFSEDMETVLRELGVSDLRIPKKMRGLAASSATLLQGYEEAFAAGDGAMEGALATSLPLEGQAAQAASRRLTAYLGEAMRQLDRRSLAELAAGRLSFPEVSDE